MAAISGQALATSWRVTILFDNLVFQDRDHTAILAQRPDGTLKIIEQRSDPDLWVMAVGGAFGAVADYVAPVVVISPAQVKAEAYRRIIRIMPEWKQRNTTAAGLALLLEHGADPANWPSGKADEVAAGVAVFTQIEAIRAASDAIEAMNPVPVDYTDDRHWP